MFSAAGNGLAALIQLTVDGGAGNDTITGGDGDDRLLGGDGNDVIDGNQGNDVALLGAGDDVFRRDPGDGSDTVDGQAGNDTMLFNGANNNEKIDITANHGHVRFTRDVGNITMDLNGVEQFSSPRAAMPTPSMSATSAAPASSRSRSISPECPAATSATAQRIA